MRKTGMSFKQIYKLTKRFFKKIEYKVLQEFKYLGSKTPSLK